MCVGGHQLAGEQDARPSQLRVYRGRLAPSDSQSVHALGPVRVLQTFGPSEPLCADFAVERLQSVSRPSGVVGLDRVASEQPDQSWIGSHARGRGSRLQQHASQQQLLREGQVVRDLGEPLVAVVEPEAAMSEHAFNEGNAPGRVGRVEGKEASRVGQNALLILAVKQPYCLVSPRPSLQPADSQAPCVSLDRLAAQQLPHGLFGALDLLHDHVVDPRLSLRCVHESEGTYGNRLVRRDELHLHPSPLAVGLGHGRFHEPPPEAVPVIHVQPIDSPFRLVLQRPHPGLGTVSGKGLDLQFPLDGAPMRGPVHANVPRTRAAASTALFTGSLEAGIDEDV